jgi:phosphonate transport system ATP-binding protein
MTHAAKTRKVGVGETASGLAIHLDGVICTMGDKVALDIEQLAIAAGERVAIVGQNGAGKSTLLRLLSGFARAERGMVSVLGQRLPSQSSTRSLKSLRSEVGQVLQGLHLVQRLSALDNVLIGALGRLSGWRTWLRWHRPEDVAEAEAALREVGLLAKADVRVDRLSGGERQKVAIARMLMQRARLILADEPTAALDPQAAAEVCALLARAAQGQRGATLISVVHNPALLPLLADRVIGLRLGRIAFDLPVAKVDDACLLSLYRAAPRNVMALAADSHNLITETT